MALVTLVAGSEIGKRPEYSLTEQAYYDRYIRPNVEAMKTEAAGFGGAGARGARKTQGQLVAAQLGGEQTSLGEAAVSGMAPAFRRVMQRALAEAGTRGEAFTREQMLERARRRAKGASELSLVTGIESGLTSLIPDYGISSAVTGVAGGLSQAALGARGTGSDNKPLQTVRFDDTYGTGGSDPGVTLGGGGLYDLYNLTYG